MVGTWDEIKPREAVKAGGGVVGREVWTFSEEKWKAERCVVVQGRILSENEGTVSVGLVKEREGLPEGKRCLEDFLRPGAPAPAAPPATEWKSTTPAPATSPRGNTFLSKRSPSPTRRATTLPVPTTGGESVPEDRSPRSPPRVTKQRQQASPGREKKDKIKAKSKISGSLFRTVVIGGGAVGKSALTIMFIQEHFVDIYDPTVEDSYRRGVTLEIEDGVENVLLDILDTAGQEEYSAMREQYMESGEGFIVVYDVTSRDSFDEIDTFYQQVLQVKEEGIDGWVPMVLCGNKSDLYEDREVTYEEGEATAARWGVPFFETSALTGDNVKESYHQLIREIWKYRCLKVERGDESAKPANKCAIL